MNVLDFMSESPNLFIFQQKTNKTNFGGVFFLLYIIVMILISLAYILDYALNEKYSYESMRCHNDLNFEDKELDNIFNPFLKIEIKTYNGHFVYDGDYGTILEKDKIDENGNYIYNINKKLLRRRISLYIDFNCSDDKNCSLFKEKIDSASSYQIADISIDHLSYTINHMNDPPVEGINSGFQIPYEYRKEHGYWSESYQWEIIKYKDQKSLFDTFTKKKTEYTFGDLIFADKKYEEYNPDDTYYNHYHKNAKIYGKPALKFTINKKYNEYLFYKRKKVAFLDVLANIGALFSTIKFFFFWLFLFIQKILIIIK